MSAGDPPPADSPWLRPGLVASWKEIALVWAVMVGPFAWRSSWYAWRGSSRYYVNLLLTDRRMLANGAIEAALLAVFLLFLHYRGWKSSDFRVKPGLWSSVQALGLLMVTEITNGFVVFGLLIFLFYFRNTQSNFLLFVAAHNPRIDAHGIHLGWMVLLGTMLLNAFFEELICMGYLFNQLAARQGPLFALLLTVLVRMSCHTYQGPVHMLGIGALFLIYGLWYWQTRNLWTLILAHALLDIGAGAIIKLLHG